MPCSDGGPMDPGMERIPAWIACEAMAVVEDAKRLDLCSPALQKWWSEHKTGEAIRVKREAAQKLSPRERLALGIDEEGNPTKRTP